MKRRPSGHGKCPVCSKRLTVTVRGALRVHNGWASSVVRCKGSGSLVFEAVR